MIVPKAFAICLGASLILSLVGCEQAAGTQRAAPVVQDATVSAPSMAEPAVEPARLSSNGKALKPIVVSPDASERVRAAAGVLADYLGRIGDTTFTVEDGDGQSGIVVGEIKDFPALPIEATFKGGRLGREDYLLRTRPNGVWLLGATELAVEHAVWDLLWRIGYRQFFPGEVWEVVPQIDDITVAVDVLESPDYYARRHWYNWGTHWHYNEIPAAQWSARNRAARGFVIENGHIYEWIMDTYPEVFAAHPEFYAMIDGERKRLVHYGTKLCNSNPDLRKFVVEDALKRLERHRDEADSITVEPSDGGNWCQCDACAEMGSVSDQAVALANDVAAAITAPGLGDDYVGMLAYYEHCAPPNIEVHPRVIVSVATAFVTGGLTLDQIIEGWKAKGATLGIYDYFTVVAWDWNLPGRARAARPAQVAESIRKYWKSGVRFYDAESGDAWGPCGLGFYIAGRVWWDINEADRVDELVNDFLTRAFGPAEDPMRAFYGLITTVKAEDPLPEVVAQMYGHLATARQFAGDSPTVRRRIDDLIVYTRYVELYHQYKSAAEADKEVAKAALLTYIWRMRETMMIHAYAIWCRLVGEREANDPQSPFKSDSPITEAELLEFLKQGQIHAESQRPTPNSRPREQKALSRCTVAG